MIPEEVSSISDQFKGLKAIHYVGELGKKLHNPNVYQGEGNQQNDDGVFRLCIFFSYWIQPKYYIFTLVYVLWIHKCPPDLIITF